IIKSKKIKNFYSFGVGLFSCHKDTEASAFTKATADRLRHEGNRGLRGLTRFLGHEGTKQNCGRLYERNLFFDCVCLFALSMLILP
ncbi:MAG: hypothetical protein KAV87_08645, partial [Desulfobacteraceae bacterium]|nr:hypothetical protein [Desulfobacteraceae bacterium]